MNALGEVPAAGEDNHALPGPGGLLRAARESAGVSLRDISAQLHLDERTVDSLERDDFDNLPAPTFVRGYLRGYARLLSVPVGPVLEAYDREGFRPPDLVADISEEPENTASDFPVSLVTWAVVLILLAMVVVWWNNNNPELGDLLGPVVGDAEPTNNGAFNSSEEAVADGTGISPGQPSLGTADGTQESTGSPASGSPPESRQTPASDPAASEPPAADINAETPADANSRAEAVLAQAEQVLTQTRQAIEASSGANADNAPTQNGSQGPASAVESADPARVNAGSSQTQTARADSTSPTASSAATDSNIDANNTQRAASPGSGEVHLVVKFTAEAWVQIVDRDEKKLFYNLAKAGQTIDLRGQGPLRVILGRTRGVEVLVDGQLFDVTPHTSKGVARFSLP